MFMHSYIVFIVHKNNRIPKKITCAEQDYLNIPFPFNYLMKSNHLLILTLNSSGFSPLDIDECQLKPCAHACRNFVGGFECSCRGGYELNDDKRTCRGEMRLNLFE